MWMQTQASLWSCLGEVFSEKEEIGSLTPALTEVTTGDLMTVTWEASSV
jgi:hypothetical protein